MADYVSTSLGRVGYALPQPYSTTQTYVKRDVVQYQGASFVVLKNSLKGVIPVDDGTNYRVLCIRGEKGDSNAEWFTGTAVSGRGSNIVAGVVRSKAGDMYLNSSTSDVYRASVADTWDWVMNLVEAVNVTAGKVPTNTAGVSVQAALDGHTSAIAGKLNTANVVNNYLTTAAGYALDARIANYFPILGVGSVADVSLITIVRAGFYRLFTGITNGPTQFTANYGLLIVAAVPNTTTLAQILVGYSGTAGASGRLATRTHYTTEGTWSNWTEFLSDRTPVTVAQGGTGSTTPAAARTALGLKNGATTIVQRGSVSIDVPAGTGSAGVGQSALITFPTAFSGLPTINLATQTTRPDLMNPPTFGTVTTTSFYIFASCMDSSTRTITVHWTATY